MPELLRRFRAELGSPPAAFAGGEPSRAALIRAFTRGVEGRDTAALSRMVLSRAEFAYLYFPDAPLSRPPYEMPPALLWFQIAEGSNKGIARLLQRHGGGPLGVVGWRCEERPKRFGPLSVWERCVTRRVRAPGDTVEARLFGSIVGRGGTYKFVGFANDL